MNTYDFTYRDIYGTPRQAIGAGGDEAEALRDALAGKPLPYNIGGCGYDQVSTAGQLVVSECNGEWLVTFPLIGGGTGNISVRHGKPVRRAGRPEGSTKPDEERRKGHEITLSDEAWSLAQQSGNASQYIERLILAQRV